VGTFMMVSDESPYRLWLAHCIEAFLRGSSVSEQLWVARAASEGLLDYLVDELFVLGWSIILVHVLVRID